jgi:hypothetical protein
VRLEQATEALHAFTQAAQARGLTHYEVAIALALRGITLIDQQADDQERQSFARFLSDWSRLIGKDAAAVRSTH